MLHAVMDSLSILLVNNLRKSISIELYMTALDILHRTMIVGFHSRKRLHYEWSKIWDALMTLIRFLALNKGHMTNNLASELLVRKVS